MRCATNALNESSHLWGAGGNPQNACQVKTKHIYLYSGVYNIHTEEREYTRHAHSGGGDDGERQRKKRTPAKLEARKITATCCRSKPPAVSPHAYKLCATNGTKNKKWAQESLQGEEKKCAFAHARDSNPRVKTTTIKGGGGG